MTVITAAVVAAVLLLLLLYLHNTGTLRSLQSTQKKGGGVGGEDLETQEEEWISVAS